MATRRRWVYSGAPEGWRSLLVLLVSVVVGVDVMVVALVVLAVVMVVVVVVVVLVLVLVLVSVLVGVLVAAAAVALTEVDPPEVDSRRPPPQGGAWRSRESSPYRRRTCGLSSLSRLARAVGTWSTGTWSGGCGASGAPCGRASAALPVAAEKEDRGATSPGLQEVLREAGLRIPPSAGVGRAILWRPASFALAWSLRGAALARTAATAVAAAIVAAMAVAASYRV